MVLDVLESREGDGKARYGNDLVRKAAVDRAAAKDLDCSELCERLDDLRRRRAHVLAEVEGLKAQVRLAFGNVVQGMDGF